MITRIASLAVLLALASAALAAEPDEPSPELSWVNVS